MGFSRQEYWRGLPFLSPGDLPDPGIEPRSPTLQADALLCTTREALKYKNTVSQKTSYRDTELSTNIKDFKGGKEARLKEEGGGGRRRGTKGVAFQTSPATYRYPGIMGLFPGLQRREDWNSALPEIRPEQEFEFSAKRR